MEEIPKAKPWMPDATPECPVDHAGQEWIEASMSWCSREFGKEVMLRDVVRPADWLDSASHTADPEQIGELVGRVCALMQVRSAEITVNLFDGSATRNAGTRSSGKKYAVGHFRMQNGQPVIDLDRSESADPAYLTAIIAHELCHVRLLGEGRITTADRPDHERLTDLLTIYFGFGIFTANAALSYARNDRTWSVLPVGYLDERTLNAARNDGYKRLGYLSEQEFGYAMGCYCWLRGETAPDWATCLDPGPQTYVARSLAYLAQAGPGNDLPTQRLVGKIVRCGNATIRVVSIPAHRVSSLGLVLPDIDRQDAADTPRL